MTAVCSENKTVTPSVYFLAALHISCVFIHCHETVIKHQVLLQTQENCYRRTHSAWNCLWKWSCLLYVCLHMFERFWEGCEDIENDPKSGQPSTVRNKKQFQMFLKF